MRAGVNYFALTGEASVGGSGLRPLIPRGPSTGRCIPAVNDGVLALCTAEIKEKVGVTIVAKKISLILKHKKMI
jgi:hypothetical protein